MLRSTKLKISWFEKHSSLSLPVTFVSSHLGSFFLCKEGQNTYSPVSLNFRLSEKRWISSHLQRLVDFFVTFSKKNYSDMNNYIFKYILFRWEVKIALKKMLREMLKVFKFLDCFFSPLHFIFNYFVVFFMFSSFVFIFVKLKLI